MSSNTTPSRNGEAPHSITPPEGFNRTHDIPRKDQDAVTDAFVYSQLDHEPVGYVVVKQLSNADGETFWSIEEYRNNGEYQKRWQSFGAATRMQVQEKVEESARNIRNHTVE